MENRFRSKVFVVLLSRMALVASLGVVVTTVGACSDASGPEANVHIVPTSKTIPVQTDQSGFSSIRIPITITNISEQRVAYNDCGAQLEQKTSSGWQHIWSNICLFLDVAATTADAPNPGPPSWFGPVIEPGAAASFIVIVPVSAQQTNTFPPTIRPESGEYRLQIPMRIELVGAVFEFSHDRSVSESFNVVVQ